MRRTLQCLLTVLALSGCAGPTTPFGALNGFGRKVVALASAEVFGPAETGAYIRFAPGHQVLHDRSQFDVIITDPLGVPEDAQIKLIYNGSDVSAPYLAGAEFTYLDVGHRQLRLATRNLRLLPSVEHDIRVIYRRAEGVRAVVADYQPPECPAFEPQRSIASIPDFDAPAEYVNLINRAASRDRLNPYFVAGLIAQESGFDPEAVSAAKGIGLTQLTSLGENEVSRRNSKWPRYPGIEGMSVLELKLAVLEGKVHAGNEWRLSPEKSILGGVDYLDYLNQYWKKPEKSAHLEGVEMGEVLLASYNSGAARVSRAIDRRGREWLEDPELTEARAYVRRVTSYCDHFSSGRSAR